MASPAYTSDYQMSCFTIWYSAGRPSKFTKEFLNSLPDDESGRKPSGKILRQWRDELGWDWKADELDARVEAQVADQLVANKVLMLKEQAARGRELQKMGMEHLREEGFDSASAAVAAVIKGADMEKTSRGLSEAILKLSKMSDKELTDSISGLLERSSGGTVIEGEVKDTENKSEDEDMTT